MIFLFLSLGLVLKILEGNLSPEDFNFATLALLPKKPLTEVDGPKWFSPKHTRPISIVNADDRILANAFRKALAGFAERICSKKSNVSIRTTNTSQRWMGKFQRLS